MLLNNDGVGREGGRVFLDNRGWEISQINEKRRKEEWENFIRIIVLHSCNPAFLRTRLLDYSLKTVKVIINEAKTHPIIS